MVKYVKLNERIEFDCDPIGQSPVDVTWFMRPQVATMKVLHNNITSHSFASSSALLSINDHNSPDHPSYQNQMLENNHSSFEQTKTAGLRASSSNQLGLGRRLYMATLRTELAHRDSKFLPASLTLQAHAGIPPVSNQNVQQLESYIKSQDPSIQSEHIFDNSNHESLFSEAFISFELMRRQTESKSEFLRLIIKQAKRQHSTDFICKATNKFGGDEKLIKLLVQEPPDPVFEITLVQVDSRSMAITWIPPYNGNSPITSYTVEWAPISNQSYRNNNFSSSQMLSLPNRATSEISAATQTPMITTATTTPSASNITIGSSNNGSHVKWSHSITLQPALTISSLRPLTSYEIRIQAHNQFGQSSYLLNRSPMVVTTTEEAPTTPPTDIRATPLSSSSLQITWLPPAQDSTNQNNALSLDSPVEELRFDSAKYSIKGYYLGYRVANSNESFVFKTVSLPNLSQSDQENLLAQQEVSNSPIYNSTQKKNTADNNVHRLKVVIDDLKKSTKYSILVQAFNSAGPGPQSDQLEAKTLANDPPPAPLLRVGIVTYTSIELQWSFQIDLVNKFEATLMNNTTSSQPVVGRYGSVDSIQSEGESNKPTSRNVPIEGYQLYYRQIDGQWIEKKLKPETHSIIASNHQQNDLSIIEASTNSADLISTNLVSTLTATKQATTDSPNFIQIAWHKNTSLAHKTFRFVLDQLSCGNPYQLYLVAYNSIGSGLRSPIIRTKTRGSAPIAPRKQDYITLNSTFVQLNLDAWMDGGCSVGNYEIRYKQVNSRSGASVGTLGYASPSQSSKPQTSHSSTATSTKVTNENSQNNNNNQQWLLLSNNISPEQRMIELRDLQPETWYSILTTAESAAGKTEAQHSFMTLDKFGHLPAEAVESASNLPALFRNNASIRSILSNFTASGNSMSSSSLIMSACLGLILFATCSLFLIRRYNNMIKDSVSMDSQTTSAVLSSTSHFHNNNNQRNYHHDHDHRQQHVSAGGGAGVYSNILHLDDSNSFDTHNNNNKRTTTYGLTSGSEHYSLKGSPCKTTTATVITGSSTNDSSGIMTGSSLCNDELAQNSNSYPGAQRTIEQNTVDLKQFINSHNGDNQNNCMHPQYHATTLTSGNDQDALDDFCSASCAASPSINSPGKFSTMVRNNMEQHPLVQQQTSRFKTMPHQPRPVSSFIPNGNYQNTGRCFYNSNNGQRQQQLPQNNDYQHHLNNEQQIYSKLRLICNSHSNYSICPEGQKEVLLEYPSQLYNPDTNNVAMLNQQQQQNQQKMLTCTLKGGNQHQQQLGIYLPNGFNNRIPEANQNELASLLLECQQQQQLVDTNEGYNQCQTDQQTHMNNQQVDLNTNNYLAASNALPINSNSTTNSTNQTNSGSSVSSNSNGVNSSTSEQHQLINMANGNNNNLSIPNQQCSKLSNQIKVNNTNQQNVSNQSQQQTNQATANEQSDYALPFPPKWV